MDGGGHGPFDNGRIGSFTILCLIVDDNKNMRRITATVLYALRIKDVRQASNGMDAIAELSDFQADLVVLDWVMSPEDGISVTHTICSVADSPNLYLPIIMLSGHTEKERIETARDAVVTEFLSKPVSVNSLCQCILNIIENPRQFVKTVEYFGPDRRRCVDPQYSGPERRIAEDVSPTSDENS